MIRLIGFESSICVCLPVTQEPVKKESRRERKRKEKERKDSTSAIEVLPKVDLSRWDQNKYYCLKNKRMVRFKEIKLFVFMVSLKIATKIWTFLQLNRFTAEQDVFRLQTDFYRLLVVTMPLLFKKLVLQQWRDTFL